MTRIAYDKSNKTLTCKGHSGYAERGKDIICAAVSATVRMVIAAALRDGGTANVLGDEITVTLGAEATTSETVMDVATECFEMLSKEYPEYVSVYSH